MYRLHKEGFNITGIVALFFISMTISALIIFGIYYALIIMGIGFLLLLFLLNFFRYPKRNIEVNDRLLLSPADGKVVVVEQISNNKDFKDGCWQVSIFMSIWNVHANYLPMAGQVVKRRYLPGSYLVARKPKSSTDNERLQLLIAHQDQKIMVQQVAGAVARRIVCYAQEGDQLPQGANYGFIRFGSRLDLQFPLNYHPLVAMGDSVKGGISSLAAMNT